MVPPQDNRGRVSSTRASASRRLRWRATRVVASSVLAATTLLLATCKLDELTSPGDIGRIVVTGLQQLDSARVGSTARRIRSASLTLEGGTVSLGFTASVQGASGWLKLDATRGTAPGSFSFALDPVGVGLGEHKDTIVFTSDAPDAAQVKLGVTFRVIGCRIDDLAALPAQVSGSLNTEDCESPRVAGRFARFYRFAGTDADSLTIQLSSPSLATSLSVKPDVEGADALASTDACAIGGEEGDSCLRYLQPPADGAYLIEVTTVASRATGDYQLQVHRPRPPDAPSSLVQSSAGSTPLLIATGGSVSEPRVLLGATVSDADLDALTLEVELRPTSEPFTGVATATSAPGAGPALTVEQTGLGDDVAYHWRARAVDATGRASDWVEYGANGSAETDFTVSVAETPATPTALEQRRVGGDALATGATLDADEIELRALVTDPDPGDQLRLEAEVVPAGSPFNGTATVTGAFVATGNIASVVVGGLDDDVGYRWRVRAVDQAGRAGPWVTFGAGATADFRVALPPEQLAFVVAPGATAAGAAIAPGVRVAAQDAGGSTRTSFEGSITIALAPGGAGGTLSGTLSATAVDGVALFDDLRIDVAGDYALVASATGLEVTSATFAVGAGSGASLAFSDAPHDGVAGVALSPAPTVRINDALGNHDLSFAGDVTLTLGANPAGGVLSGTTTVAASGGIATFGDVRIDRAGTGYTLIASSASLALAETGPITVVAGSAAQLAFVLAPAATASSGAALAVQPAVRLLDAFGNGVAEAGRVVSATIASGPAGATLANATAPTDAQGVAAFDGLTITGESGSYVLAFGAAGLTSVSAEPITLGAGSASALALIAAPSATARNGEAFAAQPAVRLRDASGNDVAQAGVAVTASIATGGGTLGGTTTVLTNVDGIAAFTELSITGTVGARTLDFEADGLSSLTTGSINVTAGEATTIARASVEDQSAPVGTAVGVDPAVLVTDQSGNPVGGVNVTFAVTVGGGSIVPTTPVATDANGIARIESWTLGTTAGANALTATVDGLDGSPVTFTATGTAGTATAILIAGGDNLTGPVGTTLGTTHDVRVVDANGNPVAGITVAWTATGGGLVTPPLSVTDADGIASTTRMLGDDAGPQGTTATATIGGAPAVVTFAITATVGGAAEMALVSGDAQAAVVATALPDPLVVVVRDEHGNPVPGVLVTWSVIHGSGTVGPTTSLTDDDGLASTTWTLGPFTTPTDSTQLARATAVGAPVNFVATSRPGPVDPAQVLVVAQPTSAGASRTAPVTITVTARDEHGNLVPNQGVVLAATGTGNTIVQPAAVTNASGIATGAFGSTTTGAHTVSATVAGLAAPQQPVVTIVPAPAARLAFVSPPTDAIAGAAIAPAVTIELLDSLGNRATSSAANVTVSLATNPGATTLGGTLTRATVAGVATFPDLSIPRAATGYQLGATSGALTGVVSGAFDIGVGAVSAARSSVVLEQGALAAGVPTSVTVTARDANDNPIEGVAVVLDATGDGIELTQPLGVTDASGVATGAVRATVVGAKSIGATIGGTAVTARASLAVSPAAVSATTSTIVAAPTAIGADGGSSTITVTARDEFSNVVPGADVVLAATGTANTLVQPGGPTNALGVATGTLSSTRAEQKVVSATVNDVELATTAIVTVGVGAISAAQSSVVSDAASLTAGAGTATITVTVRDAQGNPVVDVPVTLAVAGAGAVLTQPSANTDANGVTTGTLTATGSGPKVVTATANGTTTITQTASITVNPAAVSADQSTIIAEPASVLPGGEVIITVVARDAFDNGIPNATVVLAVSAPGGTLGQPAATDETGATQGTFSSTSAGQRTISATIDDVPITQQAQVTVNAGAVDAATSTIVADSTTLTAGTNTTLLTVTVRDAEGNPIQEAPVTLAVDGTGNTLVPTEGTTDANGVVTASLSSTRAEVKTVTATAGGTALEVPATVTVQPAALSVSVSTVQLSTPTIQADGVAPSTITVTALDAFSNPIPGLDVTLAASGTGHTLTQPGAQTNAAGVATGSIRSTAAGQTTITATIGGATLTQQPILTVDAGTVSDATSTIGVSSATLTAGDTIDVTVTARDANGNLVPDVTVVVSATGTGNAIIGPAAVTGLDGVATARFTSTRAEAKVISASVNGSDITTSANVTVSPAAFSPVTSTVVADSATISADGGPTIVTVTILDEFSNPIPNVDVTLASDVVGDVITQPTGVTDENGVATGTFDATAAGDHVVTASVGGVAIATGATVTVNAGAFSPTVSTVEVSADTIIASEGGATSTITVTLRDAQGNPLQGLTVALAADSTGHTISAPAATNEFGVTTATFSSTVAMTKTITATVGETAISTTPTIVVRPGPVFTTTSGFTVSPDSVGSDSTTVVTATVTARDQWSNPISGRAVVITTADATGLEITSPADTTDAAGVTTGSILFWTPNDRAFNAVIDGVPIEAVAVVRVGRAPVSAGRSNVEVASATTLAGTPITVTVTVRDLGGNPFPDATVVLSAEGGTPILEQPGLTDGNGVTSGTVASNGVGALTVRATVNGVLLDSVRVVTVAPGAPSATTSTLVLEPATIVSDGAQASLATVTAHDAFGNVVPGVTVVLGATDATGLNIASPTDSTNASGVATGSITATTPGTRTITASVGGVPIASADLTVGLAGVSPTNSTVQLSQASIAAGEQTTVTVTVLDLSGNPIPDATVTLASNREEVALSTPALTDENGQTTATVSSTVALQASITATANEVNLSAEAELTVTPAAVSATASTVVVEPAPIVASSGTSTSTITVTLRDQFGNVVPDSSVVISATGSGNTLTPATGLVSDASGVATATISSTAAEQKTISVVAGGVALTDPPTLTVTAGAATALEFVIQPVNTIVEQLIPTITVRAVDAFGNTDLTFTGTITLSRGPDSPLGDLLGTSTQQAVAGIATFTDLSLNLAGLGYTLAASADGLAAAVSNVFEILPTEPALSLSSSDPGDATSGAARSLPLVVPAGVSHGAFRESARH